MKRSTRVLAALIVAVLAAACLSGCGVSFGSGKSSGAAVKTKKLTVFAASSLTGPFTELGKEFEKAHPGMKVVFNFGPSSGLAEQIGQGAPAGVFASASPTNMATVVSGGDASTSKDFAKNSAEIAVPAANPAKITSLADLAKPGVKVAVCQSQVPCGKLASTIFAMDKITVKPVTEEVDVKSVLTKVSLGEVDAGMVYVTDVLAAGSKVKGIEIPAAQNSTTLYPIAVLTHAKHPKEAQAFVDFVLSSAGQQVLAKAGFQAP